MLGMICVCLLSLAGVVLIGLAFFAWALFPQPIHGEILLRIDRQNLPKLEHQLRSYQFLRGCGLLRCQVRLLAAPGCLSAAERQGLESAFEFVTFVT